MKEFFGKGGGGGANTRAKVRMLLRRLLRANKLDCAVIQDPRADVYDVRNYVVIFPDEYICIR